VAKNSRYPDGATLMKKRAQRGKFQGDTGINQVGTGHLNSGIGKLNISIPPDVRAMFFSDHAVFFSDAKKHATWNLMCTSPDCVSEFYPRMCW
jgi:hypothetical protein